VHEAVSIALQSQVKVPVQTHDGERATERKVPVELVSEFPEARSWGDYVTQYWTSDPSRHQYRAGVNMLPHERKLYKMRLIAEHIRTHHNDNVDAFEARMREDQKAVPTVNSVFAFIRSRRE
jgi:hypothetical protein